MLNFTSFSYETRVKLSFLWGLFLLKSKPSKSQPNSCKLQLAVAAFSATGQAN